MSAWIINIDKTQPGFKSFFDSLLRVKPKDLVGKSVHIQHALQRLEIFACHVKHQARMIEIAHRATSPPAGFGRRYDASNAATWPFHLYCRAGCLWECETETGRAGCVLTPSTGSGMDQKVFARRLRDRCRSLGVPLHGH